MKKTKALVASLAAAVTLVVGGGVAYAAGAFHTGTSASTTSAPVAYGACVSTKTGSIRFLERGNLAKSRYGACKQDGSETFVLLSSGVTVKMPAQLAYTVGGKHYVCSTATAVKLRQKLANGHYAKAVTPARYACVEAVRPIDVPKPTTTVTVSPSPTVSPTAS